LAVCTCLLCLHTRRPCVYSQWSSYSARWWTWGMVGHLGSGLGLKPV